MRFVLYSGGDYEDNEALDGYLIALSGVHRPTITYIPASVRDGLYDFEAFVRHFRHFGIDRVLYFPIDSAHSHVLLETAFQSHIIYLAGGNTFYFLHTLRKTGLLGRLREFADQNQGVLAGLSAGSILMTPTITTAGFPDFDRDENNVGLRNLEALDVVPFEFYAHYAHRPAYQRALCSYTKNINHPLYACPDGSGVVSNDGDISLIGRVFVYSAGDWFVEK